MGAPLIEVVVVAGRGWSGIQARVIEAQARILSRARPGLSVRYVVSLDKPGARRLVRHIEGLSGRVRLDIRVHAVPLDRGASHSRNIAVLASSADVLAFMDDDVVPTEGWIRAVEKLFQEDQRLAGAFGPVEPIFVSGASACSHVPRSIYWVFSCTPSYAPRRRAPFYRGFGANMAFRRDVLLRAGGFHMGLGVGSHGQGLLGEDAELGLRLCMLGYRVVYEPRMLVRHVVPGRRCTPLYLARRAYTVGRTNRAIAAMHGGGGCREYAALSTGVQAVIRGLPEAARSPRAMLRLALASISFLAGYLRG